MKASVLVAAFFAGLICGVAMSGRAADWLIISGYAIHLDKGNYCNETTEGLGYERAKDGVYRSQIGAYRNSNCDWSLYAGYGYTPIRLGALRFGGIAGGVTGYRNAPVLPLAALYATLEGKRTGLSLIYVPPFDGSGNVLWLQSRVRF